MMAPVVTITSDFGLRDGFVAAMKGVILTINPEAQIVDISHDIMPQDIWEGAFTLRSAYRYFPKGTVHLAVVDPGVGSSRRPIVAVTESYTFVGPDNGLFSLVYAEAERLQVHHITASHYGLPNAGPTFHGRDVFAPSAAWLSKGIAPYNFGNEFTDYKKLNVPVPKKTAEGIEGTIVHIDRFGNLITNISSETIQSFVGDAGDWNALSVGIAGREIKGLKQFYAEVAPGEPAALINSSDALEIFVFKQNARAALSAKRGDPVRLKVSA